MTRTPLITSLLAALVALVLAVLPATAEPVLAKFLTDVPASELVPGADG